ncbi:hypothetical protein JCM6882_000551 [Rhodosporidiobolus microsporus]
MEEVKPAILHIEGVKEGDVSELQAEIEKLMELSEEDFKREERALLKKIDFTLMPTLFVLLVLNYLDRNALASARVQGIEEDLGMVGTQFNTAISLLFVGYIVGQLPSNMILSRSRPSIYLSCCVFIWGMVSLSTGFVQNYHQLLAVRILLGFTESPYFPGALFILSSWYSKSELALRTATLYCGSLLSGAFSGLISAGIEAGLDGALGYESWRWLFIIEGAITGFIAILAFFILPDYPATTKRLSLRERALAVYRLERDTGVRDDDSATMLQNLKAAVCDYRLWFLAIITACKTTASAVTQFFPTVMQTFGYSRVNTLLLTTPPYILATLVSLGLSRLSDKNPLLKNPGPERSIHFSAALAFGMIGFIIAATTTAVGPRYFSLFIILCGTHGNFNVLLAWYSGVFQRPRGKRAMAISMINALGNLAQIWSPYLYPKSDSPMYTTAFVTNSIMTAVAIALCMGLRFLLMRDNARMDREEAEYDSKADEAGSEMASGRPFERKPRYVL